LSRGGEVFVLDMGEPVRIGDLARRMIRLAGLVPGRDIEVQITGARPGEKKAEVLSVEPLEQSDHNKIHVTKPGYPGIVTVLDMTRILERLTERGSAEGIREFLLGVSNRDWAPQETITLIDPGSFAAVNEAS
jgi:FlaA1/EpsC-like NDP-sugar epimerase